MPIVQFRYFNIQPKAIDITTRLRGINATNSIVYSPEPRTEVHCFSLNFNISKFGYYFQKNVSFLVIEILGLLI